MNVLFNHHLADLEDDPETPLNSQDIEKYYIRNLSEAFLSPHFTSINFTAMLQTDIKSGRQRRILRSYNVQRSCSCFSSVPVFWEMTDASCPYQLISLSESTAEYLTVANYVKKDGLLDRPIVSICRIQNQDLWEFYCRKKKQLMRIHAVTDVKERRLFHGTRNTNVDNICKYNFDIRLAGHHGHVYGKGIYFAIHATYADRYSCSSKAALPLYGRKAKDIEEEPSKVMFLARVLVGESTEGKKHLNKPDQVAENRIHDSCVDDIKFPQMYVIFDANQIYPEYLIQYR